MASNAEELTTPGEQVKLLSRFPLCPGRYTLTHMNKRGKILRDPRTGPGLLIIEGRQYWFGLDGVWKSDLPAAQGLAVNVSFDRTGKILAITAAADFHIAEGRASRSLHTAKAAGVTILRKIAAKCGMPNLLQR
jgi:hypothetical protein